MLLFVGACVTPTRVQKLHDETGQLEAPLDRILVIGVAGQASLRSAFENTVVADLADSGVTAYASHLTMPAGESIGRKQILEAVAAVASDAVLVIRLTDIDTDYRQTEGRVDIKATCRRGDDPHDYFLYDYEELKEPDSIELAQTVVLTSDLYLSDTGARIWAIQSTCFNKATMDEALREQSFAIVAELRRDHAIP